MDCIEFADIANFYREQNDFKGLKELFEGNLELVEKTDFLRIDYLKFLFDQQDIPKCGEWLARCKRLSPNDPQLKAYEDQLQQEEMDEFDDAQTNYGDENYDQVINQIQPKPQPKPQPQNANQGLNLLDVNGMNDILSNQQKLKNQQLSQQGPDYQRKIKILEEFSLDKIQQINTQENLMGQKMQQLRELQQKQNYLNQQTQYDELSFGQRQNLPNEMSFQPIQQEIQKNYEEKFNDTIKKYGQACQIIRTDTKKTVEQFQEIQIRLFKTQKQFTKRQEIESVIQMVLNIEKMLEILGNQNRKEVQIIWILQERDNIYDKVAQLKPFDDTLKMALEQLNSSLLNYSINQLQPQKYKKYSETLNRYMIHFLKFQVCHEIFSSIEAYMVQDIGNFTLFLEEKEKLTNIYQKLFVQSTDVIIIFLLKIQSLINNLDERIDYLTKLSQEQYQKLYSVSKIHRNIHEQFENKQQEVLFNQKQPEIIVALQDTCVIVFNMLQYTDELLQADSCNYLAQKINDQYNIVI